MKKQLSGRISKPFGQDGELVVNLYEAFPQQPDRDTPVWVVVDSLDVPLYIEKFDRRGRSSAVVRFADIDTPRRALEMVGREVFLETDLQKVQDGDDGELYLEDLVGFKAHLGGGLTGVIDAFLDSDLNPLLQITAEGKELLIPAADDFIEKVDERRREIWFTLPEGLLELND